MKQRQRVLDHPEELVTNILLKVPVKPLSRSKCVSKSWCNLINNQDFAKLHLKQSMERDDNGTFIVVGRSSLHSFDFNSPHRVATKLYCPEFIKDPIEVEDENRPRHHPPSLMSPHVKLIGACNGLVCFYESRNSFFSLYNPATRAYEKVPELTTKWLRGTYKSFCHRGDFAYDCVDDDYKVFNFCSYYKNCRKKAGEESHVYSLKDNSWKAIPNPPFGSNRSHSVVTNNFLHYRGYRKSYSDVILRLDVSTERYDTMSLPDGIVGIFSHLAVLRGHLHVITDDVDIWMLKDYGVESSWTRLFHCSSLDLYPSWPLPFAYSRDGQKLLVGLDENPKKFICCDLESQEAIEYQIEGFPNNRAARNFAEPWLESLVSPCRLKGKRHS